MIGKWHYLLLKCIFNTEKNIFEANCVALSKKYIFSVTVHRKSLVQHHYCKGLTKITQETNVIIEWNFTAPQHGKWLHDAEGSVIKRIYKSCVLNKLIKFDASVPFETTIVNYLKTYFTNEKESKIKRNFYEINNGQIVQTANDCKTLDGIAALFCFKTVLNEIDTIYCRTLTCTCVECTNDNWQRCTNIDICGPWNKRIIRKKSKPHSNIAANNANEMQNNRNVNLHISNFHNYNPYVAIPRQQQNVNNNIINRRRDVSVMSNYRFINPSDRVNRPQNYVIDLTH